MNKPVNIVTQNVVEENEVSQDGMPVVRANMQSNHNFFSLIDTDRIIEMAWEDRTPFDAIEFQFGLKEASVKVFMKMNLKPGSYRLWRKRVENCKTKHARKRIAGIDRFKCNLQRNISMNKISKRR